MLACFALVIGCGSADVSDRPMAFVPVEKSEEPAPKTVCVSERADAADPDLHQLVTAAFAYWQSEDSDAVGDVTHWELVEPSDDCDVPIIFAGEGVGWNSETQAAGLLAEGRMEPGKCQPYTILVRQERWEQTVTDGWAFPVIAHEIGHIFCLPHSDDPADLMYPSLGLDD
jgi:hypothetical protein